MQIIALLRLIDKFIDFERKTRLELYEGRTGTSGLSNEIFREKRDKTLQIIALLVQPPILSFLSIDLSINHAETRLTLDFPGF